MRQDPRYREKVDKYMDAYSPDVPPAFPGSRRQDRIDDHLENNESEQDARTLTVLLAVL